MFFAHYEIETGRILGVYTQADHGENIPQPTAVLTQNQWQEFLANQDRRKINVATKKMVIYTPPAPTTDELLASIRTERSRRLAACDWTQLADSPLDLETKAAWAEYRQALRDFPESCDPINPIWPIPPDQKGGE